MTAHVQTQKRKLKQFGGIGDTILIGSIYLVLILILLIILLPIINIVASSFSAASAVSAGRVTFWPVDFSLEGYKAVFNNPLISGGFINSFYIMVVGTLVNLIVTMMAAYPLSFRYLEGKKFITLLFTFTMFFGGGMIPSYLVVRDLGMINTIWSMVIPGAVSVYNIIIARTFLQSSIPYELYESAEIDGCSHARAFFTITLPLSKALLAVLTLMFAVGHWNTYFNALLYLSDDERFPLQLILRAILIQSRASEESFSGIGNTYNRMLLSETMKYALIIVSSVPVLILYPFLQKYFVKGVMIGSVKG